MISKFDDKFVFYYNNLIKNTFVFDIKPNLIIYFTLFILFYFIYCEW